MEKEYIEPEIKFIKFTIEDIIATSDEDESPILPPDPDPDETTEPTGPVETTDPEETTTDPVETTDDNESPIL